MFISTKISVEGQRGKCLCLHGGEQPSLSSSTSEPASRLAAAPSTIWPSAETIRNQPIEQQLGNPVHHIHSGKVPEPQTLPLTYGLLLNLVSLPGIHNKETAWPFVQRYAPDTSADTHAELDELIGLALNYARDFVVPAPETPARPMSWKLRH